MSGGTVVGLFAGIGGLELGLGAGWSTELLCEIDPGASAVLRAHFPDVDHATDIRQLRSLPGGTKLVTAGFPCQDLSQAGRTAGIAGSRSGLVDEVFRLVRRRRGPRWLLIENVPFMLKLARGQAMRHITSALEEMGYAWAYRVVDARAFGLPQRRHRVLMLASRDEDPRSVLYGDDVGEPPLQDPESYACGFYWTEGTRGLGWAVNAVPTLKGGSTIGIASPPAIRLRDGQLVTPGVVDAERLQGFNPDWTRPALEVPGLRPGHRWKLIGNAVSVRMSEWVSRRLAEPVTYTADDGDKPLQPGDAWPNAAWGRNGVAHRADRSMWPERASGVDLEEFVQDPKPLSARATAGFLNRARSGGLRFVPGFLDDVERHLHTVTELATTK